MQIVTVTADDNGSITVTQRAVIVNFGLALANSGGNVAASALSAVPEVQRTVIEGLIAALFGLDPAVLFGGGSAAIGTGQANATGNQSQSSVLQQVTGGVDGDETATADQSAWIGNFGAALANSGINGAAGSVAVLPDGSPIASAEAMIARFLQLLTDPSQLQLGNTELSSALNLGSALLDVHGDIDATEVLAGLDEGEAWETSEGGIRIRQITGVLNIAIALANSGDNVAISGTVGADPQTHEGVAGQVTGKAMILTGPVDVIGQRASTVVCQIIGEDDSICPTADVDDDDVVTPPVTPLPPGPPPVTPPPAPTEVGETPVLVRERPVEAGSLPRTGAPLTLQALLGLALTGGGVLVTRRTRRSH
jgi:LPXTG-motif cell wall-anchored protein